MPKSPKSKGEARTHAGRVGSAAVGAAKAAAKQAAKDPIAKHFGPLGGDGIQRPCALKRLIKVTDSHRRHRSPQIRSAQIRYRLGVYP